MNLMLTIIFEKPKTFQDADLKALHNGGLYETQKGLASASAITR